MFKKLFMVAAFTLPTFAAVAADHAGLMYLSGHMGYGKVKQSVPGLSNPNGGMAYDLALGYNFTSMLGLEGGYSAYHNQTYSAGVESKSNHSYHLAMKATVELRDRVSLYGRIGPAFTHTSMTLNGTTTESATKLTAFLGAGLSFDVINDFSVDVDLHGTTKRGSDVPAMVAIGLGFTWTPSNLF
jgi:opacity protein-like surface antigen